MIHWCSEQGESCTRRASDERVASEGGVGKDKVNVDKVVQALDPDKGKTDADGETCKGLRQPVDGGATGPGKPEQTDLLKMA